MESIVAKAVTCLNDISAPNSHNPATPGTSTTAQPTGFEPVTAALGETHILH